MALDKLHPTARRLVTRTATLAGVALLVGAGLEAGQSLKLVRQGQPAQGQTIRLGGGSGPLFVQFTRPDGNTTAFRPGRWAFVGAGDKVPVIVDPRPNAPPVVANFTALWLMPLVMGLLGAVLFAFGFNAMERPKKR